MRARRLQLCDPIVSATWPASDSLGMAHVFRDQVRPAPLVLPMRRIAVSLDGETDVAGKVSDSPSVVRSLWRCQRLVQFTYGRANFPFAHDEMQRPEAPDDENVWDLPVEEKHSSRRLADVLDELRGGNFERAGELEDVEQRK